MPGARRPRAAILGAGVLAAVAGAWLWLAHREVTRVERLPPGDYTPNPLKDWETTEADAPSIREDALARARVWRPPADPIPRADLSKNPGDRDPLETSAPLPCRFLPAPSRGTTAKFDCVLRGGEVIKVKYGGSREQAAEVAASRLLAALGFGADRMYAVPRVRCFGCPAEPFRTYQVLDATRARDLYERRLDYDDWKDFEDVAVERRFAAASVSTGELKGWSFFELDKIDPGRGGSTRAEVDALRLMAVFLHHWDNKSENQRLVCLARPRSERNGPCPAPFAMLQDVGASFGPDKLDFESWSTRPFWRDPATCTVDMSDLPFDGATFTPVRVGEAGRRFLADRITQLGEAQVRTLFEAARFPQFHSEGHPGRDVGAWVRAFQAKVRALADRPPCPPLSAAGPLPRPPSRPSA